MKRSQVQVGGVYAVKVSGKVARVRLTRESVYGGWDGQNLDTGREVRVKTAGRLRYSLQPSAAQPIPISWDEPAGCTSPRGWAYLRNQDNPLGDEIAWYFDSGCSCCGNYLEYSETTGPAGERFHAVAYVFRGAANGLSSVPLGATWHQTAEDAKNWIERTVRLFLKK